MIRAFYSYSITIHHLIMPSPTNYTDTYLDKGRRKRMCEELKRHGISDALVLAAMGEVPRHWFLDPSIGANAYEDHAVPIGCDQTISRPSTVAMQSQLLAVKKDMKVLEIGTGSGYQTAVLCAMGAKVFSIERQHGLFVETKVKLLKLGYRAQCYYGDGYKGTPSLSNAPFDRIIITCGAPFIPLPLMQQLKVGGIMVIPVGETEQEMLRVTKNGETQEEWVVEKCGTGSYRFVPMLEGRQVNR